MMKKTVVIMGYVCNNNCIFCCNAGKHAENSTKEVLKDIAKARKQGSTYLELIGGEPTIRKDIFLIVSFAKRLGFETTMFATNGRMFSNKDFAQKIIKKGLNHIVFSIHGHNPELHDSITQVPGSFNELIQGIVNVKGLAEIGTNTTIVAQNYRNLPDIGRKILELNVQNSEFIFVDPTHGAARHNFSEIVPTYEEVQPYVKELLDLGKSQTHWHIRYYPLCFVDRKHHNQISELHEKEIFETEHIAPDFINRTVYENRKNISRQKILKCKTCDLDCEGYWKEYVKQSPGFYNFHGIHAAYIHVSDLCNFRCKICDLPKRLQTYKETDLVLTDVKKAISLGLKNIIFTGQEVLLHPKIHDILKVTMESGANYITFNTNGLAFSNKVIVERLNSVKEYWDKLKIAVSVNFHDAKTYNDWSGRQDFEKWIAGMAAAEMDITFDMILKKDIDPLDIMDFIYSISSEKCHLRVLELLPFGKARDYAKLKYSLADTAEQIKRISDKHRGQLHFESFPICVFNQKDLINQKFFIYNFHLLFDDIPVQYDVNIYETYYPGKTENWIIDPHNLKKAYDKMFIHSDECNGCYYKSQCYGIPRKSMSKDINNELRQLSDGFK